MTVDSFDVVYYTSIFILPGFLIKSIINSLSPPQKTNESVYFLTCLAYSIINCAIWSWLYNILFIHRNKLSVWYWILIITVTIFGATILALIIGIIKQKDIISKILNKTGVTNINPTPTAWDYFFSKQQSTWIIVTLTDDTIIYGRFDSSSFASSDQDERDIYIEEIYDISNKKEWIKNETSNGILLSKDSIKTIEFLK